MKFLMASFFIFTLAGCVIAKMQLSPKWDPDARPSYVDYTDHWWLGFVGGGEYDLQKICVDQKPHAFEKRVSVEDGFIRVLTIGIYTPTTIRVWCGD